jgi:hypothetical protein
VVEIESVKLFGNKVPLRLLWKVKQLKKRARGVSNWFIFSGLDS